MNSIERIVTGGYCSGCGACSVAGAKIKLNEFGEYIPDLQRGAGRSMRDEVFDALCPFASPNVNEDVLSREFNPANSHHVAGLGRYSSLFAGYVKEGSYREKGTSGGMGSWLLCELLSKGLVDGVIHVKRASAIAGGGPLFEYAISRNVLEAADGAKTRYHAVELSKVLEEVRRVPGRYAFIGVPCFCKAVRRLQRVDPLVKTRIHYVLSLVCGHLKSINWTYSLAWAAGVAPSRLTGFQYRVKDSSVSPRAYVFRADSVEGTSVTRDSAEVVGGKFNAGAMMLNACDYCDDIVGETADVSIGDAWLPRYERESKGTNLLIVRNPTIFAVLTGARNEQRVWLEDLDEKDALDSQAGGIRHRREGLAYRLAKKQQAGVWAPGKRVAAAVDGVPPYRRVIYRLRIWCAMISRERFLAALRAGDYSIYSSAMGWRFRLLRIYEVICGVPRIVRRRIAVRRQSGGKSS